VNRLRRRMKSAESNISYFKIEVVLKRRPVELLEETLRSPGLRGTFKEVLHFLKFRNISLFII